MHHEPLQRRPWLDQQRQTKSLCLEPNLKRGSVNTETTFGRWSGWINVVITTCCIPLGLVMLLWKSGRVAETIDNGIKTLEEGRCSQDVLMRIMITKHGKAAHCRNDGQFLLKSHVIQCLSWCSHCNPNDATSEKSAWRRRVGL